MASDPHPLARALGDLRADLDRYRVTEGRSLAAALWVSPGTVASVHYRLAHWAWNGRTLAHLVARVPLLVAQRFVEVWSGVSIAPQATIGPGLYVGHFGGVVVNGDAVLGANTNLSQGVTIGVGGRGDARGVPRIGDRCYVGPGAKLFGSITLGDDVAVGANAVVTRSAEARSVLAGSPARVVGHAGSLDFVQYRHMEHDPARLAALAAGGAEEPGGG